MSRIEHFGPHTRAKPVWIYALVDPDTDAVRYVGKTERFMVDRHKQHISNARKGSRLPVHSWLRGLMEANKPLIIASLELVSPGSDWAERERFWIEFHRARSTLFNLTDGGEGLAGHIMTDVHRSRIRDALRRGSEFACEVCGTNFWRKPKEIGRNHNRFCSRRCSNARHLGKDLFHGA